MPKTRPLPQEAFAEHMRSSVDTTEVQRLIYDISAAPWKWRNLPGAPCPSRPGGWSFFPGFALYFQRHPMEIKGVIYPNPATGDGEGLSHVVRLLSLAVKHGENPL